MRPSLVSDDVAFDDPSGHVFATLDRQDSGNFSCGLRVDEAPNS
jgi:hypothetical protein